MTAAIDHNRLSTAAVGPIAPRSAVASPAGMVGFVEGTRVATPMGYVAVERLCAGDSVLTVEGIIAPVTGVVCRKVWSVGPHAPVCIARGVMNNMRDLRLAQGQRLRVAGWQAEMLFDLDAVLAPAKSFVNGTTITIEQTQARVSYVQVILDRHDVILAENIACDSFVAASDGPRAAMPRERAARHARQAAADTGLQAI